MQCLSSFHHLQTNPIFHQNKPPRESIICGRVDDWLMKTVFIMLKFVLKILQWLQAYMIASCEVNLLQFVCWSGAYPVQLVRKT